jgi:hypothetical protein
MIEKGSGWEYPGFVGDGPQIMEPSTRRGLGLTLGKTKTAEPATPTENFPIEQDCSGQRVRMSFVILASLLVPKSPQFLEIGFVLRAGCECLVGDV